MSDSQCTEILHHIQTHGSITPLDALNLYGCFRLGARVLDLRKQGYDIRTEMVTANGKRFARYVLGCDEQGQYRMAL